MDPLHKRRLRLLLLFALVPLLLPFRLSLAQTDLENVLKQYDEPTVSGYTQPLADLVGANMNAGFYHSAKISPMGLTVTLRLVGMGAVVGDDQKSFTMTLPSSFSQRTMEAPTLFGGTGTVVRDQTLGTEYRPSDGIINASLFPLVVPQLTVGSVFGTEATLRYVPLPANGDAIPKITLFGIGARHSISQYLPSFPVDLAAGIFYSSYTAEDLLDMKGLSIGAQASKEFGLLSLYGGIAWEQSTMNVKYISNSAGSPAVDVELDGSNVFRLTVGGAVTLSLISVFADANFGAVTNFSGGIGFGF
jgi:hypothetical protein